MKELLSCGSSSRIDLQICCSQNPLMFDPTTSAARRLGPSHHIHLTGRYYIQLLSYFSAKMSWCLILLKTHFTLSLVSLNHWHFYKSIKKNKIEFFSHFLIEFIPHIQKRIGYFTLFLLSFRN